MGVPVQTIEGPGEAKPPLWWRVLAILPVAFVVLVVVLVVVGMSVGPAYKQHVERQDLYEARAALGEMKDRARAAYQRNPELKTITKKDLGLNKDELNGTHFKDEDYNCGGTPEKFWLKCRGVFEDEPYDLELSGNLSTGSTTFNR